MHSGLAFFFPSSVGTGGSGIGAGVGVSAGMEVGVAFTVTVRVASESVLDCFGAGVGSAAFGCSMGSSPCMSVSSKLEMGACELASFVWGEVV